MADGGHASAVTERLERALRDRLRLLSSTDQKTHILSTPHYNQQGAAMAKSVKEAHENDKEFRYNPNEDCPQTLDVSWLEAWMTICNNTVRTGGTVFVMYRSDRGGRFGCEEQGPQSLDGQAQPGEIMHAVREGARITWVDYAPAVAAGPSAHRGDVGLSTAVHDHTEPVVLLTLPASKLHGIPSLPDATYEPRPELEERLLSALLQGERGISFVTGRTAEVLALEGAAGFGKTTACRWLVNHTRVQSAFPDGIHWLVIGSDEPSARPQMLSLTAQLGASGKDKARASLNDDADAIEALKSAIGSKRCLVVLDDVWFDEQLMPFKEARGPNQALVVSTRNTSLAEADPQASSVGIDQLSTEEAIGMLCRYLNPPRRYEELRDNADAKGLVEHCYGVPIGIRAVAGLMSRRKLSLAGAVEYLKGAEERLKTLDSYKNLKTPSFKYMSLLA